VLFELFFVWGHVAVAWQSLKALLAPPPPGYPFLCAPFGPRIPLLSFALFYQ